MNLLWSSWKWDTEAVTPVELSSEFFEGPFLRILFGRMAQMTEQVTYQLFSNLYNISQKNPLVRMPVCIHYVHKFSYQCNAYVCNCDYVLLLS